MHYAPDLTRKPEGDTIDYIIVSEGSNFLVRAFATGLLSAFGHNPAIAIPDFEGTISLDPDHVERSSLRIIVHSASLAAINDISDADRNEVNRRMRDEVLETDSFPDIVYECSRLSASKTGDDQYWVALNGELTLRGITHSLPVSARVSVNSEVLHATGEFSLRQSDYEISPVSAVGGTIKLKDELKFSFDITARKQE